MLNYIRSSVTVHDSHFGLLTSDPALTEMGESPNHPRDTLSGDHDVCSPNAQTAAILILASNNADILDTAGAP